ncbi:MAG: PstS family phosphate ABC transporter substrate-binding protein [Actinobacteria bacterium]|nr:PstS family phosphate ABC transporter substrate-binding protein [Actinomycetota bacterium]
MSLVPLGLLVCVLAVAAAGCGREGGGGDANAAGDTTTQGGGDLSGSVESDGSSTVGPLTTAAAERFREQQPNVNVTVGISGTGGGFERFCNGETDISNASRPIKEDEEVPICEENGIEYTELAVATDALTVVVNPENDWIDCITTDQLNAIWRPDSTIDNWSQVPGGDYPDEPLALAGPGTDSGTFDYFTDEINGEEGASRSDYTASEDDNVVVRAVSGERGALGYFGFTYYEENQDELKALAVDGGEGCVEPSVETAQSGDYAPLARPLFIYVKNESLSRPEVQEFLRFYTSNLTEIAEAAAYIPLPDDDQEKVADQVEQAITGAGA